MTRPYCMGCGDGFTWKRNRERPWITLGLGADGDGYYCGRCFDREDVADDLRRTIDHGTQLFVLLGDSNDVLRIRPLHGLWMLEDMPAELAS